MSLPPSSVIADALVHAITDDHKSSTDIVDGVEHLLNSTDDTDPELLVVILKRLKKLAKSTKSSRTVIQDTSLELVRRGILTHGSKKSTAYSTWRGAVSSLTLRKSDESACQVQLTQQAQRAFPDLVASYKYMEDKPPTLKRLYVSSVSNLVSKADITTLFQDAPALRRELTVYRGVGLDNPAHITSVNEEPISTSARPEIARQYQHNKPCCLIQIQVPAGTHVLNLNDPVSLEEGHFLQPEEIVLPPGGTLVPDPRSPDVDGALVYRYVGGSSGSVISKLERLVSGH